MDRYLIDRSPGVKALIDAIGVPLENTTRVIMTIAPDALVSINVEMILKKPGVRQINEIIKSFILVEREVR
jgi:hypothetical protein